MGNSIIIIYSYHTMSTRKIADAIANKISSTVIDVKNVDLEINLDNYGLIGFGAGIAGGKHYKQLLEYVENLPNVVNKNAFIFSTSGMFKPNKMLKDHKVLRELLQKKGFTIKNEFSCHGCYEFKIFKWTLKFNKGRPNHEDLNNAELFAEKLALI